ncbi:Stp1/IreP family PP2C-type Ser/Thr phosphatase [Chlamydiifrater phoenicopteri]|uniref:Stp1/IreP family PP2C-type Ser/Thr phosphatase n=1 Tax=Chlamydiifrater phoenicopteri TaxID=2681469 RepID=UPI001BCCCD15|nr:Stp1/IreP family PP2C-type Ser/Thr phosphatase [Chlamydiifrater phoenicopteri]
MAFRCFGASDIGRSRARNEDFWHADPEMGLFAVADGIGGSSGGEVASKEAVSQLMSLFEEQNKLPDVEKNKYTKENLFEILFKVNNWVYQCACSDGNLKGMGTTLSSLFFEGDRAYILHVGDSRIYRFRGGCLSQLTEDHSLANRLCSRYGLSKESKKVYPYRHILTNVLGTKPEVTPDIREIEYASEDIFFLCSDGLTNMVSDEKLCEVLSTNDELEETGNTMISLANSYGGVDNVTVVLVQVV